MQIANVAAERQRIQTDTAFSVSIRPYPYPFKAALAICNDLDGIRSFQELKAIHDVLNGSRETPCGPGLRLEIGDSLHFFSVHPDQDDTLSYFEGFYRKAMADAPALRDGIASGLLDTLHTWGNFSQKGGFFRKYAARAADELDKYSLQLPVWTNHGDIHNFQNLGRSDSLGDISNHSSVRGDVHQVLEYHADLVKRIGVRYLWIKELTPVPGQERVLHWRDWIERGSFLSKQIVRDLMNGSNGGNASTSFCASNQMMKPVTLRDGSIFWEIIRYGSFLQDGGDNVPELLSHRVLKELTDNGGASLLYVHLGKGRPSPDKPFSRESYLALERLAQWHRSGEIWVTTAARLCRYMELRRCLKLKVKLDRGIHRIITDFRGIGSFSTPDLSGLTFYQNGINPCILTYGDKEVNLRLNPPDDSGKISQSVPLKPMPYCWE
ncbi:MAG: hypothetical protein ABH878_05400 [bacterium]